MKSTGNEHTGRVDLLEFALTPQQREAIDLVCVQGLSYRAAGEIAGVNEVSIRQRLKKVSERAAKHQVALGGEMRTVAPAGYAIKGTSTLYDNQGNTKQTWVKTNVDQQQQMEILCDRLETSLADLPKFKVTKPPKRPDEDLLSLLTITDFHLGMYAWESESGDDWDVEIARQVFLNAIHDMIKASPRSGTGLLCQLGDFLHWDGMLSVTPASGHVLDADTRYGKLVDLSMSVMAEAVRMMLKKFGKVVVVSAEGNHDISGSIWLRKYLKHMFADEPRLEVIDNEFPYYAYLHGRTMLGFHHGHKVKLAQLHKLFASEPRFRGMWGQADYTYIHSGHYHHERLVEDGGAIAEQHPTLSARDAYAARGGWVSGRGAKIITYHTHDGEVARASVRPRQ